MLVPKRSRIGAVWQTSPRRFEARVPQLQSAKEPFRDGSTHKARGSTRQYDPACSAAHHADRLASKIKIALAQHPLGC
jgi:hypothetical protein